MVVGFDSTVTAGIDCDDDKMLWSALECYGPSSNWLNLSSTAVALILREDCRWLIEILCGFGWETEFSLEIFIVCVSIEQLLVHDWIINERY